MVIILKIQIYPTFTACCDCCCVITALQVQVASDSVVSDSCWLSLSPCKCCCCCLGCQAEVNRNLLSVHDSKTQIILLGAYSACEEAIHKLLMPSNDDFRFFSQNSTSCNFELFKKNLAEFCRHALMLTYISDSGEKYCCSWGEQVSFHLRRWLLSLSPWWWFSFFHLLALLSHAQTFWMCEYTNLWLCYCWDVELCSISWERWNYDTSFDCQIFGFADLLSYTVHESTRNDSPAHWCWL